MPPDSSSSTMDPQISFKGDVIPNGKPNMKRTKSILSRASSHLSFKSVRSHFSWTSRRRKSFQSLVVTVDQIKPHVLLAFQDQPHLFHPKDVEQINETDTFIKRYIEEHQSKTKNNWEEILNMVLDTLKWRMEFGVNDLKPEIFPKEFYDLKVFTMGQISPKEFMIFLIARRFRKFDGLQEHLIKFAIYCFESKAQEFGDDVKISLFSDVSNCGLSQVDMKLFLSGLPIFLRHYPGIAKHAYVYELPWILKPIAKIILSVLPAKINDIVTFVSKSDYKKIVPAEMLPNYMGGVVKPMVFEPVEGCITAEELGQLLNVTDAQLRNALKTVNLVLKEIEKEESSPSRY